MKTSPIFMGMIYGLMGVLFTFLAIESVTDTIWNFTTVLLMVVATFDFSVAIRFMKVSKNNKS